MWYVLKFWYVRWAIIFPGWADGSIFQEKQIEELEEDDVQIVLQKTPRVGTSSDFSDHNSDFLFNAGCILSSSGVSNQQQPHIESTEFRQQIRKEISHSNVIRKEQLIIYTRKTTDNNEAAKCPICHKTYRDKYKLKTHIADIHSSEQRIFTCPVCQKIYKTRNTLGNHLSLVHRGYHSRTNSQK